MVLLAMGDVEGCNTVGLHCHRPGTLREERKVAPHAVATVQLPPLPTVDSKIQKTPRIYRKRRGSNYTRHIPERFRATQ